MLHKKICMEICINCRQFIQDPAFDEPYLCRKCEKLYGRSNMCERIIHLNEMY